MVPELLQVRLPWDLQATETLCPNLSVITVASEDLAEPRIKAHLSVLESVKAAGISGIQAENDFWTILWALLYWDVIFQRLPDAFDERLSREFPGPRQDIPRDLFTAEFFPRRKEAFEARRVELAAKGLQGPFELAWQRHSSKTTRLFEFLQRFVLRDFTDALSKLEAEAVVRVLDRLSVDYTNNRSGLPDLLIWEGTSAALIEVKGPGDSIRENQVDWLRFAAGGCGIPSALIAINWSDRKINNVVRRLNGPPGTLTLRYGSSSSKYFAEVEDETAAWADVHRNGEGRALSVEASLPFSRIGEALPTLEKVARWKNATAEVDGQETDLRSGGPLRCLAEKERTFQGRDYCRRWSWGWDARQKFSCRLFQHSLLTDDRFEDYGYRDSERGVFIVDKEKVRREIDARVAELGICPHFDSKPVLKAVEDLPETIDPSHDSEWGWLDSSRRTWFFDNGEWRSLWGDQGFPGVAQMVSVKPVSPDERRLASQYGRFDSSDSTIHISLDLDEVKEKSRPASRSGCAGTVAASLLVALVAVVLLLL